MNNDVKISNTRNSSFDLLKIAGTFLIVFHHYQQIVGLYDFPVNFYDGKFYFGYVVDLFFIISGYLMFKYQVLIGNRSIKFKQFYLKRIIRLLPMSALSVIGFLIVTILCKVLSGEFHSGLQPTLMGIIVASGGFQSWEIMPNPWMNSPLWYVGSLLLCYLLLYAINRYAKKGYVIFCYIAIIIIGLIVLSNGISTAFLNRDLSRGFIGFFSGLIMANINVKKTLNNWKAFCVALVVFAGCVAGIIIGKYIIVLGTGWVSYDIATLDFIFYPALIIILLFGPAQKIIGVFSKPLSFLSGASFEVYLWHTPLIILWKLIHDLKFEMINVQCAKFMLLFSVLTFVWGIIIYLVFEKNIVKKLNSKI